MFETWTPAVLSLMNSSAAIWRLVRPSATSASTSRSRGVRPNGSPAAAAGGCRRRRRSGPGRCAPAWRAPRWHPGAVPRRGGRRPRAPRAGPWPQPPGRTGRERRLRLAPPRVRGEVRALGGVPGGGGRSPRLPAAGRSPRRPVSASSVARSASSSGFDQPSRIDGGPESLPERRHAGTAPRRRPPGPGAPGPPRAGPPPPTPRCGTAGRSRAGRWWARDTRGRARPPRARRAGPRPTAPAPRSPRARVP